MLCKLELVRTDWNTGSQFQRDHLNEEVNDKEADEKEVLKQKKRKKKWETSVEEEQGQLIKGCPYYATLEKECARNGTTWALGNGVNRQEAGCRWRQAGIVVYFYLSGTTCLGSLNGNFASDQRHTQGKERTAGFLAAAPGFRPTLPPPAPPLSQIFSLSLSRIFISSSSFPKDLFSSSLFFPRSVSLLSWPLHFICRSPLRSSFVILSSSNGAPICAAGRR